METKMQMEGIYTLLKKKVQISLGPVSSDHPLVSDVLALPRRVVIEDTFRCFYHFCKCDVICNGY